MWETWVRSLGWEDPPDKGMTTHSNVLAWRIPWTEEPGGLQFIGLQRVRRGLKRLSMPAAIPSLHIVRNALTFIDQLINIGCRT